MAEQVSKDDPARELSLLNSHKIYDAEKSIVLKISTNLPRDPLR